MIERCRELKLRAAGQEDQLRMDFTVLFTAKTVHVALRYRPAEVVRPMKPLRVLVLLHPDLMPPDSIAGHSEQEINVWKTEYDVISTLRGSGHEVRPLGVQNELQPIRDAIESWKPDVVFNLLEEFHGETAYDQNVASYLELLRMPYTGCNPRGLMLARGKDLSKQLLAYHRIPVPAFAVFPMRRKVQRPKRLPYPLIVKSLSKDASLGIAQASVVDSDDKLVERVAVHPRADRHGGDRRAVYRGPRNLRRRARQRPAARVAGLGARIRLAGARHALPIATERVKHDTDYQERRGVVQGPAEDLAPEIASYIQRLAKRICRALDLDGYARIDFRLSADGVPYFIEANPNPEIASSQEFAQAAEHDGLKYPELIDRLLALAIRRAKVMG